MLELEFLVYEVLLQMTVSVDVLQIVQWMLVFYSLTWTSQTWVCNRKLLER